MAFKLLKAALFAAVFSFGVAGVAEAGPTSGSLWLNDPNSGDASMVPAGAPDATFNTGAINYVSDASYTIGPFLNNPAFSNESTAFLACGAGACPLDNTFVQITGTIGLVHGANMFVVGHDDGVVMTIAGFASPVVNEPGPTGFTNTPFTVNNPGPTGNYAFTLNYTECCGPPADLLLQINSVTIGGGVPEPATWAMLLLGVGGIGAAMRFARRRDEAAMISA